MPSTIFIGALLGAGLMSGAILSHFTVIGIESKGDGGQLFVLAINVLLCCTVLLIFHKEQGLLLYKKILKKNN